MKIKFYNRLNSRKKNLEHQGEKQKDCEIELKMTQFHDNFMKTENPNNMGKAENIKGEKLNEIIKEIDEIAEKIGKNDIILIKDFNENEDD